MDAASLPVRHWILSYTTIKKKGTIYTNNEESGGIIISIIVSPWNSTIAFWIVLNQSRENCYCQKYRWLTSDGCWLAGWRGRRKANQQRVFEKMEGRFRSPALLHLNDSQLQRGQQWVYLIHQPADHTGENMEWVGRPPAVPCSREFAKLKWRQHHVLRVSITWHGWGTDRLHEWENRGAWVELRNAVFYIFFRKVNAVILKSSCPTTSPGTLE